MEKAARNFITTYRGAIDEIEVYLILQVKLKKALNLPLLTDNMLYERCANLNMKQIEEIGVKVLSQTMHSEGILLGSDLWKDYIQKTYLEEYENISSSFECLTAFKDETDATYQKRLTQITNNRNETLNEFYCIKTKAFLKSRSKKRLSSSFPSSINKFKKLF